MSLPKTLVIEQVAILSSEYGRREAANQRAAYSVTNFSVQELFLNPGQSSAAIAVTGVMIAATDGANMSVTMTKGSSSITLAFNQLMQISSALDSVVFTNNTATGGDSARVRFIYG